MSDKTHYIANKQFPEVKGCVSRLVEDLCFQAAISQMRDKEPGKWIKRLSEHDRELLKKSKPEDYNHEMVYDKTGAYYYSQFLSSNLRRKK